ncbi:MULTISPECIES: phage tail protein [Pseudomonas]|uniref:phage tail protein n=1 Tax=Pseudomonas TaxID=286 RepID=UPI000761D14C|nr:tail fiber protein [Pseudomonas monteilii]
MADPYLGEIRMAGFNFNPYGWALCQGQTVPLSQNTALFALLGTQFGGDGVSTFALPDLRGRTPVGQGQGPGLAMYEMGEKGGTETVTQSLTNMPPHNHVVQSNVSSALSGSTALQVVNAEATSPQPIPGGCLGVVNDGGGGALNLYHDGLDNSGNPLPRVSLASQTVPVSGAITATNTVSVTGSGVAIPVLSPFISVNFIIAMQGVFPTRN